MGRKKPGKPRRERAAGGYTLQQLQPPGYDQWIVPAPGRAMMTATEGMSAGAVETARRIERLLPLYGPKVPVQALWLDLAVDSGVLQMRHTDGTVGLLPVAELAGMLSGPDGAPAAPAELRASVHELHAAGAVLVEPDEDDGCVLRLVVGRPERPGDPWLFGGDMAAGLVPKACVPADPASMDAEEFAVLGYLRAHLAGGTVGTAEEYATFDGVGTVERARELFAAVDHLLDVRGCPACPSGHLCTRDVDAQPVG
ncbi:hypothetical protein ACFV6F_17465 [Kitasatospora phosalacinea]|uniref:hypothetical protein n=1 Tax=Kitasatospora phosalacinea TaxID=2065 RepID=UPI003663B466